MTPEHHSKRPIILDDSYASPETAALHEEAYEGALVAREDSPKGLLSMSAYGKAQPPHLHGYDSSRTYPETFQYAAPNFGSQSSGPASTTAPVFQNAQLTMAYPSNQVRPTYEDQAGPYLNVGSTPMPEVTSYTPSRGSRDTKVYVYINSPYELLTANIPSFFLVFGNRKCPATLQKLAQQGNQYQYNVSAEAPQFGTTGWPSSPVPICMFMESGDGDVMGKADVGDFTFLDSGVQSGNTTPQDISRKRKISTDSAELIKSPAKRSSTQQLRPKEEYSGGYGYASGDASSTYSPYMQSTNSYRNLDNHQYARSTDNYQPHLAYGYSTSGTAAPPTLKAQSPQVGNWNSYATVGSNMSRGEGVPSNVGLPRPTLSSLPSPAISANPPLIRTSTLQQTPSPATTPHGHPGQHFNAYALYPHKAKLEINGDLDAMAQHWSEEEFESRRRLVHFRRSQAGSAITTTFQPVSVDERPPNSTCISCIYWEEKQECFVTSVDTIYLLEQLVAARFTVEEKNRIRRNLEGFRPLTVSKGKSDSEEFFKVIMAFPAPKPRNIEKDVKVFHWKDLASALKKIIGKYSASPSSTLPPALLTPVSSTGYATEGSSAGMSYVSDHHGAVSPRSISGSTTSTAYTSSIPARALSPHNQKSLGLQSGPPDLRVSLPHNPHEASSHWQGGQHHMQTSQSYQHPQLSNSSSRNSWDMSTYLENNPATAAGTSAPPQALNYSSARSAADSAGSGADNRLARSLSSQQQSQQMPRT
ncbi:uncharacterized protein LY89DRAFT_749018 [Mollisia scopiformis]|uniref:DUF7082 domain-containing protein n=1 Tax=Mollisia scopiformis TaxID=149040 RepID=A0A194X8B8_MOLSC|nr:uncharacterized protein LY89DRAFT_749018 [Mollisia scopiformis]KUJ16410.1 hypothetical protein LY89DRAFT_749018 [Mollisia scopiformis]